MELEDLKIEERIKLVHKSSKETKSLTFKIGIIAGYELEAEGTELKIRALSCPSHKPKLLFSVGNFIRKIFDDLHPRPGLDVVVPESSHFASKMT